MIMIFILILILIVIVILITFLLLVNKSYIIHVWFQFLVIVIFIL